MMKRVVQHRKSLSSAQKRSRLASRIRKPEWQRYGATLLAGKVAGVGITLLLMVAVSGLFFANVYAADSTVQAASIVNPVNTTWTLIAAFLVFGMQVGFTMLETAFCRSRETVNVLMECIVDTCLCGILFYAIGFAFMFSHGNGFIGYQWFSCKELLKHMSPPVWLSSRCGSSSLLRRHLLHHHLRRHDRPLGLH